MLKITLSSLYRGIPGSSGSHQFADILPLFKAQDSTNILGKISLVVSFRWFVSEKVGLPQEMGQTLDITQLPSSAVFHEVFKRVSYSETRINARNYIIKILVQVFSLHSCHRECLYNFDSKLRTKWTFLLPGHVWPSSGWKRKSLSDTDRCSHGINQESWLFQASLVDIWKVSYLKIQKDQNTSWILLLVVSHSLFSTAIG